MTDHWAEYVVEEIAARSPHALSTGPFGSSIGSRFFQTEGIPIIRGGNLSQDVGIRLVDADWVFVSGEKAAEFSRSIVRSGDLIFTCWGTIDQIGMIDETSPYPEYVISNKQMKLTPDTSRFDSHFLYYLFKSPGIRDVILSRGIGSSVPGFNLGQLRRMRISAPPLATQKAIARVLRALDDKIRLNRKMNLALEAIASALFKSWFVDFDPVVAKRDGKTPVGVPADAVDLFPSHFEDSALGPIPRGWTAGGVDDQFSVVMGQSPPGSTYNQTGEGLPFYQGRTDFGFRFPTRRVYCTAPTRMAEPMDALISVRAPVGDVNMAAERCAIGRGVAAARHKAGRSSFGYYAMQSLRDEFDVYESEGTLFGAIGGADFRSLQLTYPSEQVLNCFESIARPLDDQIALNERETTTLTALRDTLLPGLLSGEVTLKAAEKTVAEVV